MLRLTVAANARRSCPQPSMPATTMCGDAPRPQRERERRCHRPPRRPMTAPTAVPDRPLWCRIAGALSQVLACLARGTPAGWRRRGRRRRQRTRRIARSRRSATRRPHPAGPGRSHHEELPQPALHTGTSCIAGRERRTRARTARVVPPGAGGRPAGPAPIQRVRSEAEEHLAGESVIPRMQWHELAHQLEYIYVVGEPVEQGPAGGHRVLECGPLPGRHTTTVGQNHQSPGGLNSGCLPAASQCSTVTRLWPPSPVSAAQ